MSAIVIDGKQIAEKIKEKARAILAPVRACGLAPALSVIIVGNDPASQVYVRQKAKACADVGLLSKTINLESSCTQEELEAAIAAEVDNPYTVGVLVQLPLPPHLNEKQALRHIPSYKDVDGFSHVNVGKLWKNNAAAHNPCTPQGIMFALEDTGINLEGKHVVIVGRSNTVGKPLAALMLARNATVTICHSKTKNLSAITKQADVLVCAVGKPKLITANMVKEGAVVIDVGINRIEEVDESGNKTGKTKLVGDVDFASVVNVASYITPVPGGVGPLTVAQLMLNTCTAAENQKALMKYFMNDGKDGFIGKYKGQPIVLSEAGPKEGTSWVEFL